MCVKKSIKEGCEREGCPIGFLLKSRGRRWLIIKAVAEKYCVSMRVLNLSLHLCLLF